MLQKEAATISQQMQSQAADKKIFSTEMLDFNYQIETPLFGEHPPWVPLRVFNDGAHVYIQMPKESETTLLPALFVLDNGVPALVNYRFKSPYYVVDQLFKKAVLETGTGQNQQSITITYKN